VESREQVPFDEAAWPTKHLLDAYPGLLRRQFVNESDKPFGRLFPVHFFHSSAFEISLVPQMIAYPSFPCVTADKAACAMVLAAVKSKSGPLSFFN
jgi:hypothetical protein